MSDGRFQQIRPFRAVSPEGQCIEWDGQLTDFCAEHGLTMSGVSNCLHGRASSHKGWRFTFCDQPAQSKPPPKPPPPVKADSTHLMRRRKEIFEGLEELGRKQRSIVLGAENGGESAPPNWNPTHALKVYQTEAESLGLSLKHVADARTEVEKFADAVEKLDGLEALWPEMEAMLGTLEEQFDLATRRGAEYFAERNQRSAEGRKIDPKVWTETVTKWVARLRRMRTVIDRVRNDVDPQALHQDRVVSEAVSLLRYMLFVMRSDMETSLPGNIFVVGKHMVKMAVDLWESEGQVQWTPFGPRKPMTEKDRRDHKNRTGADAGDVAWGIPYDGCMLMYPPRHTKTSLLRAWVCRKIARDQRVQLAYIHDMEDEASKFNRYVQTAFDRNTETGRRNYSLYNFQMAAYDNDAMTMRLQVDDPPKCPNLTCAGVWSSKLGINLDGLIVDDVVPKKDQDQPTMRERRKAQFKRVWLTRFHGSNGFYIVAGYPWHHEDLVWDTYQEAKRYVRTRGKAGQCLRVSKMAVGGPDTSPPFYSIWPEMYPPGELRRRYQMMNDAAGWAANWMLNPITDDLRIVRRVRLYDPNAPEHREFMERALIHLSLDPSATNRAKSDKTGLVRAAIGDVIVRKPTEWGEETQTETVLRVLDAEEFHATQAEAADRMAQTGRSSRVDFIHIEVSGGYGTSARDLLQSVHGVSSIIEHKPGMRNKEQRLRAVAPLLEDGSAGLRAKVEFPGVRQGNALVADPRVQQIVDYVVNFRVTTGHHSLDALTQLCKHVAHELGAGEGAVSGEIRAKEEEKSNRIKRLYEEMQEGERDFEELGVLAWAQGAGA